MEDNRKNNKIFKAEDFDKPSPKRSWSSKYLKQILLGVFVVICFIIAIKFIPQGCDNGGGLNSETPNLDTLDVYNMRNDSLSSVSNDSVSSDSIITPQIVDKEESKDISGSITEENKTTENKTTSQTVVKVSDDVEKEALSVIRGKYGNNPDRRRLLKDRYQEIQSRVNEMYRNGEVK